MPIGPTNISMGMVTVLKKHKPAEITWKESMSDKNIRVVTHSP